GVAIAGPPTSFRASRVVQRGATQKRAAGPQRPRKQTLGHRFRRWSAREPFGRGIFDVVGAITSTFTWGALNQSIYGPNRPVFSVSNGRRALPSAHRGSDRLRHLFVGPIGNCNVLEPRCAALQGLHSR